MAHAATAGTSSCAMISVGWFKGQTPEQNEEYRTTGKDPVESTNRGSSLTPSEFYSQIIYPPSQPLGTTKEYTFDHLMDLIDECRLSSKMIQLVLNNSQRFQSDGYWHKRAKDRGFRLMMKAGNKIGSTNYVYVRCPLEEKIVEGDA